MRANLPIIKAKGSQVEIMTAYKLAVLLLGDAADELVLSAGAEQLLPYIAEVSGIRRLLREAHAPFSRPAPDGTDPDALVETFAAAKRKANEAVGEALKRMRTLLIPRRRDQYPEEARQILDKVKVVLGQLRTNLDELNRMFPEKPTN